MPISPDFTPIYSHDWEINFIQCTPNKYLRYTDLCHLVQLTAAAHSELGGISFVDMQEFHQAWVLSKMRVEIIEMPKWKDKITIKTWATSLDKSRSIRALEIYVNEEKKIGIETFWAVFNTKKRRPEGIVLPHEHFIKYPEKRATRKPFSKIILGEEKKLVAKKTVYLSDLDVVNHVNNVKYLEWCLDFIEVNKIINEKVKSFDMSFFKELSLNDEVEIYNSNKENTSVFSISKENKTVFALELNWEKSC